MNRKRSGWVLCAGLALGGCAFLERGGRNDDIEGKDLSQNAINIDVHMKESRTLSALAKLETSLSDFYKAENRIPQKLDTLIPRYLAEIPTVETSVKKHKDTAAVQYYPSDVIRDGQIDGTKLKDTGRWGYSFNERQVIIFVDCTHTTSRGNPWYQERGVY